MLEPSPVGGVGGSGEPYHATMDTTKRRKHAPPAASNEPSKEQKVCHLHQYPSSSSLHHSTTTSTSSSSLSLTTKSARRKKKMYSDFVGVTYNKTHAKYQACITHYRKQHYLGRYKLAVDAALAYDESARLLKGTSWKVNFQSRQEYEKAKAKELASVVGRNGGKAVDVAGSLAAVASKVEEIASTVAMSSSSGGVMIRRSLLPIKSEDSSYPLHEQRSSGSNEEDEVGACDESETSHVAMKGWTTSTAASTELPPPDDKSTSLNTTKVTPSPTLPISPPMISSEQQQVESVSSLSSQFIHEQLPSSALLPEETPLPVSPNPTRHALGNEKNTPDSVIRPKVLTYRPGGTEIYPLSSSEAVSSKASPLQHCQSTIQEKDAKIKVGSTTTARHFSTEKSHNIGTSITTTTAMKAEPVTKSPRASAPPPPVIQNGTLAAASALMTLFGNERSPQD